MTHGSNFILQVERAIFTGCEKVQIYRCKPVKVFKLIGRVWFSNRRVQNVR